MNRKRKDKKARPLLGPLELEVMKVAWEREDVAVSDVVDALAGDKKPHHNTVMTVMKRLAEKGLLEQYARDGRTNGYRPAVSRESISNDYLDLVKEQFFDGSVAETIAAFIGRERLSPSKKAALKKLIDRIR